MDSDTDYKNALPGEVDDQPDSGMPRQLRTHADGTPPLSRREADVAGLTVTSDGVYGDSDADPNHDDQVSEHRGSEARTP